MNFLKRNNVLIKTVGFLQATRITTSFVISLIILFPDFKNFAFMKNDLFLAFNLLLTSMGGFALNDYFDFEKDKINKPHRPIPSQKISRKSTLYIAGIILTSSFVLSIYTTFNIYLGYMQIIFIFAMIFYNYITKTLATAKTVYTALVSALLIFYTIFSHQFQYLFLLLPVACFFFILGREIFMDILDTKGDKYSQMKTIPIKLGIKRSTRLAFCCLILGFFFVIPIMMQNIEIYNLSFIGIIIISFIIFSLIWKHGSTLQKRAAIIFLWIPMIAGLTTLL